MPQSPAFVDLFNNSILMTVQRAVSVTRRNPSLFAFFVKSALRQRAAARRRAAWAAMGVHVPPMMITSITRRCNLKCGGCYAMGRPRDDKAELPVERWREILAEADKLGVSIVMVAGGEPFTRPSFMSLTAEFERMLFPVFTNGLLLTPETVAALRKRKNLIPVFSLEGGARSTDARRGEGVSARVGRAMESLSRAGVFYGTSITVTRANHDEVTDPEFIRPLVAGGCRLFFYVEYIPVEEGTEDNVLTESQKAGLEALTRSLRDRFNAEFIAFPGDEERYGGCLAAGRGFIHVGPDGSLEPCPFAPYADVSLAGISLKEALASDFLRAIRDNHDNLTETRGGCALWTNREWVKSLLPSAGKSGPVEQGTARPAA
jgi:MoaA/NifB/PqqE/SkfB family radical SAM enzyme